MLPVRDAFAARILAFSGNSRAEFCTALDVRLPLATLDTRSQLIMAACRVLTASGFASFPQRKRRGRALIDQRAEVADVVRQ
jgi:hypothetical protein